MFRNFASSPVERVSADFFCWIAKTWMRLCAGQQRFRQRSLDRSRSGRSGRRTPDIGHEMSVATQIEKTFHEEHGRVLAALIAQLGDFELAEDALQDQKVGYNIVIPRDG